MGGASVPVRQPAREDLCRTCVRTCVQCEDLCSLCPVQGTDLRKAGFKDTLPASKQQFYSLGEKLKC